MTHQIEIKLLDLLSVPGVRVDLHAVAVLETPGKIGEVITNPAPYVANTAHVTFHHRDGNVKRVFDLVTSQVICVSTDFNLFGNNDAHHRETLKLLFEYEIEFRVTH